jgi:hypothetical protein
LKNCNLSLGKQEKKGGNYMKKTIYTTPTFDLVFTNQDVILASSGDDNFVSPGDDWGLGGNTL